LILLVLILALIYCTSPVCGRFSDVRETSLCICGGNGRRDVPLEKMDVSSVVAVKAVWPEIREERLKRVLIAEEIEDLERTDGERLLAEARL
jgi:hypothetical protein